MNQTKKVDQSKLRPQNSNRRPKRCMICRKMFAFEKYNEHYEACCKAQQKKIEEARLKQKNARNVPNNRPIQMPTKRKQVQEKPARQNTQEGNRFRIKSMINGNQSGQYKSGSVLVNNNNKKKIIKEEQKPPEIQEIKIENQIKTEKIKEEVIVPSKSTESIQINEQPLIVREQQRPPIISNHNQPALVERRQTAPNNFGSQIRWTNLSSPSEERNQNRQNPQPNRPTLIEANIQRVPPRQEETGYNIQALINNSNSIIEFIRSINILGQDQTMSAMLAQLEQLNLIAEQIVQLSSLGHAFGSTMGNLFAARIHQLQTVITNQIGIALIRGFNQRLGAQFEGLMQNRPELKVGFSEAQIEELFPEKVNFNRKECSICLDDMKPSDLIIELQCFHMFHPGCIKQWLISSRKCPMCRKVQQEAK